MDKDLVESISSLVISMALIGFAAYLVTSVPGAAADNIATSVVTFVAARWLQQGAQKSAERQAEKIQAAVMAKDSK